MVIHEIHNIKRRNPLISYRREYHAKATISYHNNSPVDYSIEFSLELSPLGTSSIRVKLIDTMEYPSMPVLAALKDRVHELDRSGSLP